MYFEDYAEVWGYSAWMTVFALGETGAKVIDRAAVEWPESERQVQWWCRRTDYEKRAYSEACAAPDFCAGLADRAGEGAISQEKWDSMLDRVETLMGWKALLKDSGRSAYIMILADQKQRFDFLAAASLAKIALGQGQAVIGVITMEEPGSGDALAEEALREERRLFREAAGCTICLPRTAEQAPETLLWPVARTLAFALATPIWIDFDFADIKALFQSGKNAWIDTGSADRTDAADAVGAAGAINAGEAAGDAEGDNAAEASRDINAVNAAMDELFASSVFVKHVRAASGAFLHFTAPPDIGLAVIDQAASRVLEEVMDPEADVVWTANFEKTETDRVCITLIVIADD